MEDNVCLNQNARLHIVILVVILHGLTNVIYTDFTNGMNITAQ